MSKKGSKTQTQTTTSAPPAYLDKQLQFGLDEARRLYNSGGPQMFQGQTYADLDPLQLESLNRTVELARAGDPAVRGAQGFLSDVLSADSGSNPYLDQILDVYGKRANAQAASNFNQSGRYGSGAHAEAAGRAISEATLPYLFDQYNKDLGYKFDAAQLAPGLADQDFINASRIGTAGDILQSQKQNEINDAKARFDYEQNAPYANLDNFLNSVYSNPASKFGTNSQTTKQSGNALSEIIGNAATLGSMFVPGGMAYGGISRVGGALSNLLSNNNGVLNTGRGVLNTIGNAFQADRGYYGPGY